MDPDLSPLGLRQANMLPLHPHLGDVRWVDLVKAGRVRVLTSPMLRTVQTSFPLLQRINAVLDSPSTPTHQLMDSFASKADAAMTLSTSALLASVDPSTLPAPLPFRATLHPDFCERGGLYAPIRSPSGSFTNQRTLGLTRTQLAAAYGGSHTAEMCGERGWWNLDGVAEEEDHEYFPRVDRAIGYVLQQARAYAATLANPTPAPSWSSPSTPPSAADYLLVVSHADFIDSFLTRILRLGNGGHPRHVFYATNTSVSHVEVKVGGGGRKGGAGGGGGGGEGGSVQAELDGFEVRIRCTNSRPRGIEASTPPADEPEVQQNGHQ